MPNYQETVQAKRLLAAQEHKEKSELSTMMAELKKIQMASMMAGQGKSTVILTDQTDLGDKIKELTTALTSAVKSTDTTGLSKDQLDELKSLQTGLNKLTQAVITNKPDNSAIISAIKGLKLDTVVNVPKVAAPIVKVAAPDLKPLQDTMREVFQPHTEKLDLSCYRAQDISQSGNKQYVGFLNTEGDWYIIENDMTANTMRYAFGSGNYAKAFPRAAQFEYRLLNEAVNAA